MSLRRGTRSDDPGGGLQVIQSAGGLLWRDEKEGRKLAVVHRPRYDDWTLPKGKLDHGESWAQAAVREVLEETDCEAVLGPFAGCACYEVNGVPKIVLFWHMSLVREGVFKPSNETDQLAWLTVQEALKRLNYRAERALLAVMDNPVWK